MFFSYHPYLKVSLLTSLFSLLFVFSFSLSDSNNEENSDILEDSFIELEIWSCEGMFDEAAILQNTTPSDQTVAPVAYSNSQNFVKVAEEMPRFPGCEEMTDRHDRKTCSDKNLLEFIYENITLPECYRVGCAHHVGTAVISFIVEKNGSMSDINLTRDPGHGLGDSALASVQKIQEQAIRWTPGKQDGKLVRIQMNVPVRFHLE